MSELRALAEQQYGMVARRQCRQLGFDADALESWLRSGEWSSVSPRVLRRVGAPRSARAHVMACVLDAGASAVASHRTAAALWRLSGFALRPAEVAIARGADGEGSSLGRVHRPRSLPTHHCTVVEGIPVTTPARTLFDLGGVLHPDRTARAVDNALAKSPALLRVLHRMLPELAERGRTGITVMRGILADRPFGYVAPASGLEARVIQLLEEAGIRVRRQVDLGGDDWIGRVDLLVEGTNLVIEVDSVRYHSATLDRERDVRRDAEMSAAGYEVLRISEEEVWREPAMIVRRVHSRLSGTGITAVQP